MHSSEDPYIPYWEKENICNLIQQISTNMEFEHPKTKIITVKNMIMNGLNMILVMYVRMFFPLNPSS